MKKSIKTIKNNTYITICNDSGLEITLNTTGAGIREVKVPDNLGVKRIVTLSPLKEEEYLDDYHGKIVGRTAGRIENATFNIDGKVANLDKNNFNIDNLHAGNASFAFREFAYKIVEEKDYVDVIFSIDSPDGDGGYFGAASIIVTYRIYNNENKIKLSIEGIVSEKTLLNITNHVYWNLSGDLRDSIDNHYLYLNSSRYGILNERLICNEIKDVNKYFDFRKIHKIGDYLSDEFVTKHTGGYDHPFVLDSNGIKDISCILRSNMSGISLYVKTTYPCVVFYSDNFGGGKEVLPGYICDKHMGVCLECQFLPNGINLDKNNCGICSSEEPYYHEIEYYFN